MSIPPQLLTTKLSAPLAPPDLAPRPRLVARLAEGLTGQLTLLSAPAGSGKTTLINAWRTSESGCKAHLAWLLLDDDDNDPVRFLTYLIAALDTFSRGIAATVLSLLQSPQPPEPKMMMTALINALNELLVKDANNSYVLILDDYHVITAQPIHEALADFLAHLPAHVRLLISSRADPPFPLARLRARHQLTEIRSADLAFTPEDAAIFLNQVMHLTLSPEQVAALTERTEGWIAGLQLAALSLRGRDEQSSAQFITGFTGNNQYIVDYLMEEVLAHEPEQTQDFLLYTSLLPRLTGSLCDALTGRTDGQSTLEMLEKRDLFLIALDDERRWYRYHQLFADVLHSRLQQANPGIIPQLHTRAADWYEQQGNITEAVHHALAAGARGRTTRLIEQDALTLLMRGELVTLQRWFRAIEQWNHGRPWLYIYQAWTYVLGNRRSEIEPPLQAAESLLAADAIEPAENRVMQGHMAAIRSYAAAMRGDTTGATRQAEEALSYLDESNGTVRSVVAFTLGGTCWLSGDLAGAIRAFTEAGRSGRAAGNLHIAVPATAILADLQAEQGQLHQSMETYREALQLATEPDGTVLPLAGRVYTGMSRVLYEWNDLQTALHYIQQSIQLNQHWGNVESLAMAYVMQARLYHAQGQKDEAMRAASHLAHEQQLSSDGTKRIEAARVQFWLMDGHIEATAAWMQQNQQAVEHTPSSLRDVEKLTLTRVLLARHDSASALSSLERLLSEAEAAGQGGRVIELLILRAVALQDLGDTPRALHAFERALLLAEPEHYTRLFLDEGVPVRELLRRAGSQGIAPQYVATLLVVPAGMKEQRASKQQPLIEPLSQRELDVLRLIVEGYSNQEIARELVIALGTVKAHTASLYRKLNVATRTQAVVRATALNLL